MKCWDHGASFNGSNPIFAIQPAGAPRLPKYCESLVEATFSKARNEELERVCKQTAFTVCCRIMSVLSVPQCKSFQNSFLYPFGRSTSMRIIWFLVFLHWKHMEQFPVDGIDVPGRATIWRIEEERNVEKLLDSFLQSLSILFLLKLAVLLLWWLLENRKASWREWS